MKESWYHIKCPYCFNEFAHDQVHFRIAEESCEYALVKKNKEADDRAKASYDRFLKRSEADQDPYYDVVWGEMKGGTPTPDVENLFKIPWVDNKNKNQMIHHDYIADKDGFIERIQDQSGSKVQSRTRICPHCHNKLPLHYGKNPQIFISVLGVSESGKTVYLKQLLSKLQDPLASGILSHVDGSFVELTLPEDDKSRLEVDQPLPDSTKTLNFKIPYFVTMTFGKETYDFVIYDVAGEILSDFRKNNENKFKFFAGYIEKSDAIIFIVEPKQFVSKLNPKYPAHEMIATLNSVFGGNVTNIPTAVTITKSDLLRTNPIIKENLNPNDCYFNENSSIRKDIPWDPSKRYFYTDEHARLSGQLRKFYNYKAPQFYDSVRKMIEKNAFFAVSALFDGVDQILTFELRPKGAWKSSQIDAFIEACPILEEKLKEVKSDLEQQEADPDASITNANSIIVNRSFRFDQNDEVVRRLDLILERVTSLNNLANVRAAVYDQFDPNDVISLKSAKTADRFGDTQLTIPELINYINLLNEQVQKLPNCDYEIYMRGYPRRNGDLKSLRIEEPFFWLLSELDIIDHGDIHSSDEQKKSTKPTGPSFNLYRILSVFGGKNS